MKKENTGATARRLKKQELQTLVMEFLQKEHRQAFNYKQIAYALGATHPANRTDIINLLDALAEADEIQEVSLGRYKAKSTAARRP